MVRDLAWRALNVLHGRQLEVVAEGLPRRSQVPLGTMLVRLCIAMDPPDPTQPMSMEYHS